jgi:GDP-4-dehydro-6-deoxy-D-mannose reductase
MKALITGISGFVGSHLAEYLMKNKTEVYGTIRHRSRMNHIQHLLDDVSLVECELRDSFTDIMEFSDRHDSQ